MISLFTLEDILLIWIGCGCPGLPCSKSGSKVHLLKFQRWPWSSCCVGCGLWHRTSGQTGKTQRHTLKLTLNHTDSSLSVQLKSMTDKSEHVCVVQMKRHGFRHFVGIDGSEAMLTLSRDSELYQALKQCMLGEDPLPVQQGRLMHHFYPRILISAIW